MWLMAAALGLLCAALLGGPVSGSLDERFALAFPWLAAVALSLPLYVHFGLTRFTAPAARFGYGAAVAGYLLCQAVAIGLSADSHGATELWFVQLAGAAAVAVPSLVLLAQRRLRRRLLAA